MRKTNTFKEATLMSLSLYFFNSIILNPEASCSKPLDGSKVDSAFHPSEVDKMSTRNLWEPRGKK